MSLTKDGSRLPSAPAKVLAFVRLLSECLDLIMGTLSMSPSPKLPLPLLLRQENLDAIRVGVETAFCHSARYSSAHQPHPEFFTIDQRIAVLAVSRSQLYRLFECSRPTLVKKGRASLVSCAEISAYAESLRSAALSVRLTRGRT